MCAFLGFKDTKHIDEYPAPSGKRKRQNILKEEKPELPCACKVLRNVMPSYII